MYSMRNYWTIAGKKVKRAYHIDSLIRQGDLYSVKYTVSAGIVETGVY